MNLSATGGIDAGDIPIGLTHNRLQRTGIVATLNQDDSLGPCVMQRRAGRRHKVRVDVIGAVGW